MICELLTIHDILQTSLTVVAVVVVVVVFCLFLLWVTDGAPYVLTIISRGQLSGWRNGL